MSVFKNIKKDYSTQNKKSNLKEKSVKFYRKRQHLERNNYLMKEIYQRNVSFVKRSSQYHP